MGEERIKPEKMGDAVKVLMGAMESAMKHNSQAQLALVYGIVEATKLVDDGSREAGIALSMMEERLEAGIALSMMEERLNEMKKAIA